MGAGASGPRGYTEQKCLEQSQAIKQPIDSSVLTSALAGI